MDHLKNEKYHYYFSLSLSLPPFLPPFPPSLHPHLPLSPLPADAFVLLLVLVISVFLALLLVTAPDI